MDKIIKSEIVCPITQQIFYDPVIAQDSIVYEKEAIQQWFKKNSTSPITREEIEKNIYEIRNLKSIITEFIKHHPEEKVNQYKPDRSHRSNQQNIENILQNDDYYKLLEYDNFSMSIFFTKYHKLFIKMLQNSINGSIRTAVLHIIDNCIDLEFVNEKGNTLVYYLFWYSGPAIIHRILAKNVKTEYSNKFNIRPVHKLCANREINIDTLDMASKYIHDWHTATPQGITPFREICRVHYSSPYLVKYFIEKFIEKNIYDSIPNIAIPNAVTNNSNISQNAARDKCDSILSHSDNSQEESETEYESDN